MPTFQVLDTTASVPLKPQIVKGQTIHVGQAVFTVNNLSGQTVTAHLSAVAQGNAKAEWLKLQGDPERNFAGSETQKVTVDIAAPTGTPPGEYKFLECVSNNNDRDNDYTNSAIVTFTVPPTEQPKPGIPWWVWLIVAGVVLAIGIVLAIVLWPSGKVAVPNVSTGQIAYADAQKQITDAGLTEDKVEQESPQTAGNVIAQDPAAGTEVDKGSLVHLTVAKAAPPPTPAPTVAVPDVTGQTTDHAKGVLDANGFAYTTTNVAPQGKTPGTVASETPAAGTQVTLDKKSVVLGIDPGVTVPNVVNAMLSGAVNSLNANFQVSVSVQSDGGANDQIVSLTPAAGTVVAKGSKLAVVVHGPKCVPGPRVLCLGNFPTYKDYSRAKSALATERFK
ncbi:MAG TPA: PASTA domain-containing protein [Rhizomicrobium sp.]|nr:PASTA domain-containing protein [Rhizomicrobium sp.]